MRLCKDGWGVPWRNSLRWLADPIKVGEPRKVAAMFRAVRPMQKLDFATLGDPNDRTPS